VALRKGHSAARKRYVGLADLEDELFIISSKDVLPSLHQMIAAAFLNNHMPLDRYQTAEHFQTGVNLTKVRAGFMFLPSSAKDFVPDGVVLRTPGFSIGPLDTFGLWSRGNVDPLVHRVLSLQRNQEGVVRAGGRTEVSARLFHCTRHQFIHVISYLCCRCALHACIALERFLNTEAVPRCAARRRLIAGLPYLQHTFDLSFRVDSITNRNYCVCAKRATKRELIVVATMISRMIGTSVFSHRTEYSVTTTTADYAQYRHEQDANKPWSSCMLVPDLSQQTIQGVAFQLAGAPAFFWPSK